MKEESKNRKDISRRNFISKTTLTTLGTMLGVDIVFGKNLPKGMEIIGLSDVTNGIPGKSEDLVILGDKPWNAETPAHLLDPVVTPNDVFFVRNNGNPPSKVDLATWTLTIDGESAKTKKVYTLQDLKTKFKEYSYNLVLECGGNGRNEFSPNAKGTQWTVGAVGCAKWTGVRLKDVLQDAGIKGDAVYIGYYGADVHLSGDTKKEVISRGVPMRKALEDEALIAWKMNDQDIPLMNGYPLRLVFGGWPASTSGKWLKRIAIRNKIHDGEKMTGHSYKMPKFPVAPGSTVADEDMEIIEEMPVKSIITYPKSGAMVKGNKALEVRGHAWAGDLEVAEVHISIDFGSTWQKCSLSKPVNKNAWQQFNTQVTLPQNGYYEIWAKATDSKGIAQPMVVPNWNPQGYLNNACHRIAVKRI